MTNWDPKKIGKIIPMMPAEQKVIPMTVGEAVFPSPSTRESDVAERIRRQTQQYIQRSRAERVNEQEDEKAERKVDIQLQDARRTIDVLERTNRDLNRTIARKEEDQLQLKVWLLAITRKLRDMNISIEEAEEATAFLVEEAMTSKEKEGVLPFDNVLKAFTTHDSRK